jgi:hypothetical protein
MKISRRGFLRGLGGAGAAVVMPGAAFAVKTELDGDVELPEEEQRIGILSPYLVATAGELVYAIDKDGHQHEAHDRKGHIVPCIEVHPVRRLRKILNNLVRYAIVRDDGMAVLQIYTEPAFNYRDLDVPVHLRFDEPIRSDQPMTSWIQTDGISLWYKARKLRSTQCGGVIQRNWRHGRVASHASSFTYGS